MLILPSLSLAWQGKVVGISDGDTITVLHNNTGEKIRLYGIDTPEKRQDFGNKAKQFTSNMVFGKDVEVESVTKDRYGRTVGLVYINDQSLNEELVRAGFAWVYIQYCKKAICAEWCRLEAAAKANKIGLWSHSNPIPPWEFRHGKSLDSRTDYTKQADTQSFVYHGNMKSKVLHAPGCRYYDCKNCTAVFNNREEAIRLGYNPCKLCQP
ncbi:MAG: thermonuclease family protein [Candidatus Desulfaltia sp.]|nr:thermonuclease family protein [Candidatus Desulfaltia sp.]